MNPYRSVFFELNQSFKKRSLLKTLVWKFLIWSKGTWKERFIRWRCEYEHCSWQKIDKKVPGSGYIPNRTMLHMMRHGRSNLVSKQAPPPQSISE